MPTRQLTPRAFCRQFKLSLVAAGLLICILAVGINLALRYQHMSQQRLDNINTSIDARLSYLATALWNINDTAVKNEIAALTANIEVYRTELSTPLGQHFVSGAKQGTLSQKSRLITRNIYHADTQSLLGVLRVYLYTPIDWNALLSEALVLAGTQLLQLFTLIALAHYLFKTRLLPRINHNIELIRDFYHTPYQTKSLPKPAKSTQDALDELDATIIQAGHQISLERRYHEKTEEEVANQRIEYQEEIAKRTGEAHYLAGLLKQICRLSTEFLTLPQDKMDAALREALYEISIFLGLDTCFVVVFDDGNSAEIRSFWRKESLSVAPLDVFLKRHRDDYATSFALLGQDNLTQVNINKLPSGCVEHQLSDLLQLESTTIIRLDAPERTIGLLFAGMHISRSKLSDIECRLLGMTGNIVANLLLHREEQNNTRRAEAELHTTRMQLAALIQHDKLTGLHNAQAFQNILAHELRRAQRRDSPFCVLLLCMDRYVEYCAHFGEAAGDEALLTITQNIRQLAARASDMAAYLDNQCFALVLPDTPSDRALYIAQKLLNTLNKEKSAPGDIALSTSIALLRYQRAPSDSCDIILQHGAQLIRAAQLNGGGCIEIYDAPAPNHPRLKS